MTETSLSALLTAPASTHGGSVAVIAGDRSCTFQALDQRSRRIAAGLRGLGLGQGDRIALWMPNSIDWLAAFFAINRLGATVMSTNTRLRGPEIEDIFARSGVVAAVYCPNYRGIDYAAMLDAAMPTLPALRWRIEAGDDDAHTDAAPPQAGRIALASLAKAQPMDDDLGAPDAIGLLLTTSGTTRRPKLVMHRQASLAQHAHDVARSLGYTRPQACAFAALPLCGTFGLLQALACVAAGAPMVMQSTFDAQQALAEIRAHRVTLAAMTDEMIRRLYAATPEPTPFPGLRLFTGSRAQQLVPLAQERGFTMIGLYGSSEAHALFAHGHDEEPALRRTRGGGRPVSPLARVRATHLETGEVLAHGAAGQLEFNTPTLFTGYLGDEEATRSAFTADGWFRTGDLGFTESDGSFTYLSRMDDALRLKGFLVNPREIEAFLNEIDGVQASQVVGADGADGQPCAAAFYTTASGAPVPLSELQARCAQGLASYKVPRLFVHLQSFPQVLSVNAVKIDRVALRRQAAQRLNDAAQEQT